MQSRQLYWYSGHGVDHNDRRHKINTLQHCLYDHAWHFLPKY
ncbi:unnamed protein product, partial [Larinioides sclopetarius]